MNDNTPLSLGASAAHPQPRRRRARAGCHVGNRRRVKKAKRFRVSFDPMMTIPLCCTIILALDALLG